MGLLNIGAANQSNWDRLVESIGLDELKQDNRFDTSEKRQLNQKELEIILEKIFVTKSSKEWIDYLLTNSIPAGPILNMKEVWNDPHLKSRNMDVKLDHPAQKSIQNIGVAVKLHSTPGKIKTPAPLYGEHTKDILLELNFSKSEIEDLIQNNIAGMS